MFGRLEDPAANADDCIGSEDDGFFMKEATKSDAEIVRGCTPGCSGCPPCNMWCDALRSDAGGAIGMGAAAGGFCLNLSKLSRSFVRPALLCSGAGVLVAEDGTFGLMIADGL